MLNHIVIYFFVFSDENSSSKSELILGDVDSSKYVGPITYVPVVIERYWKFQMDIGRLFSLPILFNFRHCQQSNRLGHIDFLQLDTNCRFSFIQYRNNNRKHNGNYEYFN